MSQPDDDSRAARAREMLRVDKEQRDAARASQKDRHPDLAPFPDDLVRRTVRVLTLMRACAITDITEGVQKGARVHVLSEQHAIPPALVGVDVLRDYIGYRVLDAVQLGGETLREMAGRVMEAWAVWHREETMFLRLDPERGVLVAPLGPKPPRNAEFTELCPCSAEIPENAGGRLWAELASPDWSHHGMIDATDAVLAAAADPSDDLLPRMDGWRDGGNILAGVPVADPGAAVSCVNPLLFVPLLAQARPDALRDWVDAVDERDLRAALLYDTPLPALDANPHHLALKVLYEDHRDRLAATADEPSPAPQTDGGFGDDLMARIAEMGKAHEAKIEAARARSRSRHPDLAPFPEDLGRLTQRVLTLMRMSGISRVSQAVSKTRPTRALVGAVAEPSRSWGLDPYMAAVAAEASMDEVHLGGDTLRDLVCRVFDGWARFHPAQAMFLRLDPEHGVLAAPMPRGSQDEVLDGQDEWVLEDQPYTVMCPFSLDISADADLRLWAEHASPDWSRCGFIDITEEVRQAALTEGAAFLDRLSDGSGLLAGLGVGTRGSAVECANPHFLLPLLDRDHPKTVERLATALEDRPLDRGNDHGGMLRFVAERQAEKLAAGWERTPGFC